MSCNCFTKRRLVLLICGLIVLYGFIGCRSAQDYKADADERVYNIIDKKWQEDFGSRANYKISDTEPSPNAIEIEKTLPADGVLTLPQAVALATAHNREYQLEKELLYTMALDLRLTRHEFETKFFGAPKGMYAKAEGEGFIGAGAGIEPRIHPDRLRQDLPASPQASPQRELRGDRLDIVDGFGFEQLLSDGTRIATNVALAWGRILTGALKGEGFLSVLSVEVARPLLRGRDRRVVLENLTQAERDALYQIRSFNRFRKTFVVSIITEYYRVLELADTVENAKENCRTLDRLCRRVEKLADFGRVPREELQRIRQESLQARHVHIQAEKDYKQALDDFKFWQLSLPVNAELQLDVNELEALRSAEPAGPRFSKAEAIEAALGQRLDLANSSDAIIDAERKVFVAADALGVELNIAARINVPLQDLTSDTKQLEDMFLAGLELDLPFDRVAEQNIYRKALITLSQRQRQYEEMADLVTLEVRSAYRDLTEASQRYSVQLESLELAEKRLKDTCLLLQYGRASSRRVLNAQSNLFEAQNEAVDALTDYTIATLNFYCASGVLGVRPDGMWQHKFSRSGANF